MFIHVYNLRFGKLTWQWNIPILYRKYIFKGSSFHCYLRLPECRFCSEKISGRQVLHWVKHWPHQAKSGAGSTTLGAGRPVGQGAGGCCKWGRVFIGFLSGFSLDWLKNDEPDLLRCKNKKVVSKKLVAVCLIYSSRLSFTSILGTCPFCSAFWWFFPDCMVIPFL